MWVKQKKVNDRAKDHFKGKGNDDVYKDYKLGHEFLITAIPLQGSGYIMLDDLEKHYITGTNAYTHGYNKTSGNS
jgi:hypothetical protein